MKKAYIKPAAVVVAMEKLMLDTISNPDVHNGAPDNSYNSGLPDVGTGTVPNESKGHDSWGGGDTWNVWDDENF